MIDLTEITPIELEYLQIPGSKPLGKAYRLLKQRWIEGGKDRETALRLMFLAWYTCAEPNTYTGLPSPSEEDTSVIFQEVFNHLRIPDSDDAEILFALGVMTRVYPECMGAGKNWELIGRISLDKAQQIKPEGFHPREFLGRGAYGDYFANQVENGTWPR